MSADDRPEPSTEPAGPAGSADSSGTSFLGRTLTPSPFAGDDGSVDEALALALGAPGGFDVAEVHAALVDARVFVPVLAVVDDDQDDEDDRPGRPAHPSKEADMALPVLKAPDGRETMPAFSTVAALTAWDPAARPVPALAQRVALVAVQEGRQLLVLDVAGPTTVVLPRPALWALAKGQAWMPAPRDPAVAEAVSGAVGSVGGVVSAATAPGQRAELRVVLTVVRGLDRAALKTLTDAVGAALGASEVVAERVDSLELELVPAPERGALSSPGR